MSLRVRAPSVQSPAELRGVRALFISPHLDDVALSCGGAVARLADQGARPAVVTCFTEPPVRSAALGPLARELHRIWRTRSAAAIIARRKAEDRAAVRVLGARLVWLRHREAIYRGVHYSGADALFGPPVADDAPLMRRLGAELLRLWRETERAEVYLPLAVGGHVDHRLCLAAARSLRAAGAIVRCYEDFPYCAAPGALAARLAALRGARCAEIVDVTPWLERRIAAIACYTSQQKLLFGDASPADATRRYARSVGPGRRAGERFWTWRSTARARRAQP